MLSLEIQEMERMGFKRKQASLETIETALNLQIWYIEKTEMN